MISMAHKPKKETAMNINRPHIIARKSILPAFKFSRIFFFLIFAALAAFCALMGKDILGSVSFLSALTPYVGYATLVFALLAAIPVIKIVIHVIKLRTQYVEFYGNYVIKKRGIFSKTEEKCMFPKVLSCNVHRTFWGRIFNYGNVSVDAIGKWDVDLTGVKRPLYIRKYLENHFISAREIRAMRQTVVTQ